MPMASASTIGARVAALASQVAEAVLVPPLAHARLVLGRRAYGRRKALVPPFGASIELPRAGGIDQDAVPQARAEAAHVAVVVWGAGVDRGAEDPGEDHDAILAGVDAMGEGPVDLLIGRRVDVLFHHGHVLVAVLRGAVPPERSGDLLGLSLV